jgi:hypothetical protein
MSAAEADLVERIARLERRLRIASIAVVLAVACCGLTFLGAVSNRASAAPAAAPKIVDVLRVRQLDVVDHAGVTRVKLAAPLPNATIDGKTLTRGGRPQDTMSGMLLFDAEGVERSGYVTADHGYSNVLLTLDDKHKQHAMFIAEPTGATTLRLFNGNTQDRVDVGIDEDGPSITMVRRGKEFYRQPAR